MSISADFPYESHYIDVYGSPMHYIEEGQGHPILFLHGVPTSSYVWRNVIPHLASLGRCIAPDLIGFGRSAKPDIAYQISDHIKYIEKFIETLKLDHLILVMHGWGSIIGFDYAMRHPEKCKGLVFYEAYLRSMSEGDVSLPYQEQMLSWQMQDNLDDLVINGRDFVNKALLQRTMRELSKKEMDYYAEPFIQIGSTKPLTQYLQELSHTDSEGQLDLLVTHYTEKLISSPLPKLMLYSLPGFITTMATVMWAKEHLSNLEIAEVGEELHYAQESNPILMGKTIGVWLQGVEQNF